MLFSTPSPGYHSAPPAPAAPVRYGFEGIAIGSTMADLQRIRPKASCAPTKMGMVDCITPDQPVGGGYYARDLRYRFINGHLAQIEFISSIDGFAFVVAKLKHDFGEPADIRRDDVRMDGRVLPHVAFTWRNGRSTIQMSDPNTADTLNVTITFDADKSRLDAGAA